MVHAGSIAAHIPMCDWSLTLLCAQTAIRAEFLSVELSQENSSMCHQLASLHPGGEWFLDYMAYTCRLGEAQANAGGSRANKLLLPMRGIAQAA